MQREVISAQFAKPKVMPSTVQNEQRQKHIDVLSLYQKHNDSAKNRMDAEDRLAYIRECKKRIGLEDDVFLKSSRRTLINGVVHKEMPYLEFSGYQRPLNRQPVIAAHELPWSYDKLKEDGFEEAFEQLVDEKNKQFKQMAKEKYLRRAEVEGEFNHERYPEAFTAEDLEDLKNELSNLANKM